MDGQTPIDAAPSLHGDTLALGVVLLLASSVLQRAVGFAREICFCRWLSPGTTRRVGHGLRLPHAGRAAAGDVAAGHVRAVCRSLPASGPVAELPPPHGRVLRHADRAVGAGDPRLPRLGLLPGLRQPRPRRHGRAPGLCAAVHHRLQFSPLPHHGLAEPEGRVAGRIGQQRLLRRAGHRAFVLRPEILPARWSWPIPARA